MDKRPLSEGPGYNESEQPSKIRRIARACLQCRTRKQRCLPTSDTAGLQIPCKRCRQLAITCSFETDQPPGPDSSPSPSRLAQLVVEMQQRLNAHEARILVLETGKQLKQSLRSPMVNDQSLETTAPTEIEPHSQCSLEEPLTHSPTFTMDKLNLDAPIATLRSLGALTKDVPSSERVSHDSVVSPLLRENSRSALCDPVTRGILSIHDAQKAINIFFDHCHPLAPVLSEGLRYSALDLRAASPTLFLAICSVGTRFWENASSHSSSMQGLHPRFFDIIKLLDTAVSRLLLRPTPNDVSLDSIRVLLLYAQWMPCSQSSVDSITQETTTFREPPKSRYNDISAWAVLGLAARYAVALGLDRNAMEPFQRPGSPVSEEDMSRVRVLNNLLTCDYNLMLTSGLPASVNPAPAASIGPAFSSHRRAQYPSDLRVTALVELVVIAHRATHSCGDLSGRQLDAVCLRKANTEFDEWEQKWMPKLRHTDSQHNQLPFNSIRWYRLALNSGSLGPLLSSSDQGQAQSLQVWRLQSLELSLTAASQMLFSLSSLGEEYVWSLDSQNAASFPTGDFSADASAVKRLCYAVDSTWISLTFAATFLVLCYVRATIDDDLRICSLTPAATLQTSSPLSPRPTSILARLLRLALEIFDGVCHSPAFHPARDFQAIVHNAVSLTLAPENPDWQNRQEVNQSAMQSLLDLMGDSGLDWPGGLFDTTADFSTGWGD